MKGVIKFMVLVTFSLSVNYVTCADEKRYCNEGLGECTGFTECSNATVFNHGDDSINVRFNVEEETEACHYLEMCCDPEDVVPPYEIRGTDEEEKDSTTEKPFAQTKESSTVSVRIKTECPDYECPDLEDTTTLKSVPNRTPLTSNNECNADSHECIPYFYCAEDHTTDGAGEFSMRSGGSAGCTIDTQVCCPKQLNILRMKPTMCGIRNKAGIGYSVTNSVDEAQYAEFPWMAALIEIDDQGNLKYICGGSLIDPNVILTGAHCVAGRDSNSLVVRLGEWDTQTTREILPHFDIRVARIIVNDDFGPTNLINDVALIVLERPTELKVHVNTICLPPANFKVQGESVASGWGADKFGADAAYRVNLKKIDLPTVPLKTCQDSLRTTKLGPRFKIHPSFMCAGGELGVDTCTGDGGSPLIVPVPGRDEVYYQVGIVAWGIECGQEGIPGVYASVPKFRSWIDGQMIALGYGTSSYTVQ